MSFILNFYGKGFPKLKFPQGPQGLTSVLDIESRKSVAFFRLLVVQNLILSCNIRSRPGLEGPGFIFWSCIILEYIWPKLSTGLLRNVAVVTKQTTFCVYYTDIPRPQLCRDNDYEAQCYEIIKSRHQWPKNILKMTTIELILGICWVLLTPLNPRILITGKGSFC